jgi:hypothetical protein
MIPKLTVRLQAACHSRNQGIGDTAAGYSHTYFHDEDAPSSLFSDYPSDENIKSLATIACNEARYLWSLLGYETVSLSGPQPGSSISDGLDDDGGNEDNEDLEDNTAISDRRELLDAIEATSRSISTGSGLSREDSGCLHEYTFAVAALNLQDFSDMYVHSLLLTPI